MYMTRMELDLTKRSTVLALSSPNKLHGAIESSFSDERKRRLWRIDSLRGKTYILLVSEEKPHLEKMAAQFAPDSGCWETREYGPFLQTISCGSRWHFRLAANPTISKCIEKEKRGKVYAHLTVEQQKSWLYFRAKKNGFHLDPEGFDVVKRETISFLKGESRNLVTLGTCVFEGSLQVTDVDLFKKTLTEGIGRGKAYGLGLLTIARG